MKYIAIAVLFLLATLASAQTYVGLSDKSTVPYTTIVSNMQKFCGGNVIITTDENKAQYMLLVNFTGYGWETPLYMATHAPDAGAALALIDNQGSIVYSKETKAIHNAFKDMCKDYFGSKKKKK